MSGIILGTAGHIDHGKTALVRALTGTDTDRLSEEKARGITIELGFAELAVEDSDRLGVVDVPGHEAFVRAMVAGAAGMDVVILVVAADEGVMPQTREHLSIIELLDVPELVVAITKCDAVEDDWLELVDADVADLLESTRYRSAARIPTSAIASTGLEALIDAIVEAAGRVRSADTEDLVRLPLDRVFTIQGTGTVVTGTLWTGRLAPSDRVRVLPQGLDARVRAVQVHDRDVSRAEAGDRTAVALSGDGADRERIARGSTLVTSPAWEPTWMLTARVRLLEDTGWTLAHNQRVHVHHGTAEVLARCALLEPDDLGPGDEGWVQLRLESPLAARARDRFVIRAYSPVTTMGGGIVAEPAPAKRNRLDDDERGALDLILGGSVREAIEAHLELRGWAGSTPDDLPIHTGAPPAEVAVALDALGSERVVRSARGLFAAEIRAEAERRVMRAVADGHAADPLRPAVSLASVRAALPKWAPSDLADAVVDGLVSDGALEAADGGVRSPGHRPELSPDQERASRELQRLLSEGGLAPPSVEEMPAALSGRGDIWSLLRHLEGLGRVTQVADGLYVDSEALGAAARRVSELLAGRRGLGPADFKEALPVSRKTLIPLLNYFDGQGTTIRQEGGRDVPERR